MPSFNVNYLGGVGKYNRTPCISVFAIRIYVSSGNPSLSCSRFSGWSMGDNKKCFLPEQRQYELPKVQIPPDSRMQPWHHEPPFIISPTSERARRRSASPEVFSGEAVRALILKRHPGMEKCLGSIFLGKRHRTGVCSPLHEEHPLRPGPLFILKYLRSIRAAAKLCSLVVGKRNHIKLFFVLLLVCFQEGKLETELSWKPLLWQPHPWNESEYVISVFDVKGLAYFPTIIDYQTQSRVSIPTIAGERQIFWCDIQQERLKLRKQCSYR